MKTVRPISSHPFSFRGIHDSSGTYATLWPNYKRSAVLQAYYLLLTNDNWYCMRALSQNHWSLFSREAFLHWNQKEMFYCHSLCWPLCTSPSPPIFFDLFLKDTCRASWLHASQPDFPSITWNNFSLTFLLCLSCVCPSCGYQFPFSWSRNSVGRRAFRSHLLLLKMNVHRAPFFIVLSQMDEKYLVRQLFDPLHPTLHLYFMCSFLFPVHFLQNKNFSWWAARQGMDYDCFVRDIFYNNTLLH